MHDEKAVLTYYLKHERGIIEEEDCYAEIPENGHDHIETMVIWHLKVGKSEVDGARTHANGEL